MFNNFVAVQKSLFDYYPFGMAMPGRSFSTSDYRYGFNGMEKDDEIKGSSNSLDFGSRIYDSRTGRWLSLDPLQYKYPNLSAYCSMGNNPIRIVDKDGKKLWISGEVALSDIMNLVPDKYKDRITVTDQGEVLVNMTVDARTPVITVSDAAGLELLNKMFQAKENYLYQTYDEISENRQGGDFVKRVNLIPPYENGVDNWSSTKRTASNSAEMDDWSKLPPLNKGYRPIVDESRRKYEGIVTVAPNVEFTDIGGEKRNAVVFHELSENYERTTNKQPYGIPGFDNKGNSIVGTDFDYIYNFSKGGAHSSAIKSEENFHDKSVEPGKADVKKK